MKGSIAVGWLAGLALGLIAAPLSAQTTIQKASDILNNRAPAPVEPVRVEPTRVETVRRTTVIVPRREIIVVERVHSRRGWWNHPKYRVITVYYDGGRFYRWPFDRRPLRKVVVYERAGRYYIDEGHWRRDHRRHYGRDYDGWKDDDKDGRGNNGRHLGRGHDKDKDRD
jgi:hypothetical protein